MYGLGTHLGIQFNFNSGYTETLESMQNIIDIQKNNFGTSRLIQKAREHLQFGCLFSSWNNYYKLCIHIIDTRYSSPVKCHKIKYSNFTLPLSTSTLNILNLWEKSLCLYSSWWYKITLMVIMTLKTHFNRTILLYKNLILWLNLNVLPNEKVLIESAKFQQILPKTPLPLRRHSYYQHNLSYIRKFCHKILSSRLVYRDTFILWWSTGGSLANVHMALGDPPMG
jgi:hypothetical protein